MPYFKRLTGPKCHLSPVKPFHLIIAFILLISTSCNGATPALPTIDVRRAVEQTLAAAPVPTETPPPPTTEDSSTLTATIQPTSVVVQPGEKVLLQPTFVANNLTVTYIDVGQGDATLITTPDGKTVLIDGGESDSGIVPYLQSIGVSRIDLMIATHLHTDHTDGLTQVLGSMPVTTVVANGQPPTSPADRNFQEAIAIAQAKYMRVMLGDTISLGGLTFHVLYPASITDDEDPNNNSLVLRLIYGNIAFLFMGDAGKEAEANILSAGLPVQAQILKVGHHGSKASSSATFLAKVKPEVAIYFAGQNNPNGYPSIATLNALATSGAKIYGTDINGTITVATDGNGYQVNTTKEQSAIVVQATPLPAPKTLTLDIISITNPVAVGGKASLVAKTWAGAECTIVVYYKSGLIEAPGLGSKTANGDGRVAWTWKVGLKAGDWKVVITATLNEQTVTEEASFVVQK